MTPAQQRRLAAQDKRMRDLIRQARTVSVKLFTQATRLERQLERLARDRKHYQRF